MKSFKTFSYKNLEKILDNFGSQDMKPAKMGSRLLSSIWQIDFNRYEDNSVDLVYLLSSSVAARLGYCENESRLRNCPYFF